MYHLHRTTLAFYKAHSLFKLIDKSGTSLRAVSAQLAKYLETKPGEVVPESQALLFYLLNHAWAEVTKGKGDEHNLGDLAWLGDEHVMAGARMFQRMFYYLLIICTREMRHGTSKVKEGTVQSELNTELGTKAAKVFTAFAQTLPNDEVAAMKWMANPDNVPADLTLGQYLKGLSIGFHNGNWGSAFGGKKWGVIADTILNMVTGVVSPEVMVDVAWALAHNGGPIFNKQMLFSHQDDDALLMILDCQRAGQIPALILEKGSEVQGVNMGLVTLMKKILAQVPGILPEAYVDWHKVKAAGALGNYEYQIKMLDAKLGKKAAAAAPKVTIHGPQYYVAPGKSATKVQRKKAA